MTSAFQEPWINGDRLAPRLQPREDRTLPLRSWSGGQGQGNTRPLPKPGEERREPVGGQAGARPWQGSVSGRDTGGKEGRRPWGREDWGLEPALLWPCERSGAGWGSLSHPGFLLRSGSSSSESKKAQPNPNQKCMCRAPATFQESFLPSHL